MKTLTTLVALLFALALPVGATTLVIPNTFTNGTPADANQVNANFNAVAAVINGSLDATNLNASLGLPPSLLKCTSSGTCTVATGFPVTIAPTVGSVVPLIINTQASPSVDALDVNINSVNKLAVNSSGVLVLASALPIASGGTGSATQNFLDLTSAQSASGQKLFTSGLFATGATGVTTGQVAINTSGSNMFLDTPLSSSSFFFRNNASTTIAQLNAGGSFEVAPLINSVNTLAYVPPVYTAAGAALANTTHIVTGQTVVTSGVGGVSIALSAAAQFSTSSSYQVVATSLGSGPTSIAVINNLSTGFTLQQLSGTSVTVYWVAIGS